MSEHPHSICHSWRAENLRSDGRAAGSTKGRPVLLVLLLIGTIGHAGQLEASGETDQDLHGHIGANNTSLLAVPAGVLPAVALNLAPCSTSSALRHSGHGVERGAAYSGRRCMPWEPYVGCARLVPHHRDRRESCSGSRD